MNPILPPSLLGPFRASPIAPRRVGTLAPAFGQHEKPDQVSIKNTVTAFPMLPLNHVIIQGLETGTFTPLAKQRITQNLLNYWADFNQNDPALQEAQAAVKQWQDGGYKDIDLIKTVVPATYGHIPESEFMDNARETGLEALVCVALDRLFTHSPRQFKEALAPVKETTAFPAMADILNYVWLKAPLEKQGHLAQQLVSWPSDTHLVDEISDNDKDAHDDLLENIQDWLNATVNKCKTPASKDRWLNIASCFGGISQGPVLSKMWQEAHSDPELRWKIMHTASTIWDEKGELVGLLRTKTEATWGTKASTLLNGVAYTLLSEETPNFTEKSALLTVLGAFGQANNLNSYMSLTRQQCGLIPANTESSKQVLPMTQYFKQMLGSLHQLATRWQVPGAQEMLEKNQNVLNFYLQTRLDKIAPHLPTATSTGNGARQELERWCSTVKWQGNLASAQTLLDFAQKPLDWPNKYQAYQAVVGMLEDQQANPSLPWVQTKNRLWSALIAEGKTPNPTEIQQEDLEDLTSWLKGFSSQTSEHRAQARWPASNTPTTDPQ